jgi:hypothetical protein
VGAPSISFAQAVDEAILAFCEVHAKLAVAVLAVSCKLSTMIQALAAAVTVRAGQWFPFEFVRFHTHRITSNLAILTRNLQQAGFVVLPERVARVVRDSEVLLLSKLTNVLQLSVQRKHFLLVLFLTPGFKLSC